MTPNIFKKIIYHLKTIVHCLSPKTFFHSRRQSFTNQLEVMNNNNYSEKRVPKCIHVWKGHK